MVIVVITSSASAPISDVGPVHKAPPAVATQLVVPTQLSDGPVSHENSAELRHFLCDD